MQMKEFEDFNPNLTPKMISSNIMTPHDQTPKSLPLTPSLPHVLVLHSYKTRVALSQTFWNRVSAILYD